MLVINMSELDSDSITDKYTRLSAAYFLHLSVVCTEEITEVNKDLFYNRIAMLENLNDTCQDVDPNDNKLFYSLQLTEPNESTRNILLSVNFQFDLWIINTGESRKTLMQNVLETHQHLQSLEEPSQVSIGVGNVPVHDDIDWLLLMLPAGIVRLVYLPCIEFPNLRNRTVDLVHSFGCNAVVGLDETQLSSILNSEELAQLASNKYGVTADTFLIKCLLQFGSLVALPLSLDEAYLVAAVSRLCHPFVHRKVFVSAVKIITLQIDPDDLEGVAAASEQEEAKEDALWLPFAVDKSPPLALSYRLPVPVDSDQEEEQ